MAYRLNAAVLAALACLLWAAGGEAFVQPSFSSSLRFAPSRSAAAATALAPAPQWAAASIAPCMGLGRPALRANLLKIFSTPASSDASTTAPVRAPPAQAPPSDIAKDVTYSESTQRSLAKAFGWRLTAAVITLVSGLVFSKDLSTAASIVASDFVTKSGTMFLGERVWNKVSWGKGKKSDGAQRSLAKAVLWRIFAAANTLVCGAFLAKDFSIAAKIAGSDTIVKTALFYVNERIWAKVEWGKQYDIDFVI
jgi:uncharacterized membrane protein